jgi:hypothetical protein
MRESGCRQGRAPDGQRKARPPCFPSPGNGLFTLRLENGGKIADETMHQPATPMFGDEPYDDLERAVLETPRGRWFLGEFARRNRTADTHAILAAIERIEHRLDRLAPVDSSVTPPAIAPVAAPAPSPPAMDETPIDALMARLTAALEETSREMQAAERAGTGPATFDEIDAMSPDARLRLFY